MPKRIAMLTIIVLIAYVRLESREISHGIGVVAPKTPIQLPVKADTDNAIIRIGEHHLTPLARFDIEARVLSKESYWMDELSDLSPVDLAMGWGRMSDESVLQDIEISQSNRFFFWQTQRFPIPRQEIESHVANMHIIPADDDVKAILGSVRKGHVISITGYLVDITSEDGKRWHSSLSRTDTGAGACEIILAKKILIKG